MSLITFINTTTVGKRNAANNVSRGSRRTRSPRRNRLRAVIVPSLLLPGAFFVATLATLQSAQARSTYDWTGLDVRTYSGTSKWSSFVSGHLNWDRGGTSTEAVPTSA